MRHKVKKIRFKHGKDASKMLVRKLIVNFISYGKIETSLKKAKTLKSLIEKFVEKTKIISEANKNILTAILGDRKLVDMSFKNIGQPLKAKKGGYVRVVRLGKRDSDGAEIARLEWVYPIVLEKSPSPSLRGSKPTEKSSPAKKEEKKS